MLNRIDKAQAILANVLSERMEKVAAAAVVPPRCAVRIAFYHKTHIDYVAQVFQKQFGEFTRVNDSLIKICENHELAQKVSCELNSLVYAYNDAILSEQFTAGWLSEYLEMQSLSINVIMTDKSVTSIDDEIKRQRDKENGNADPDQFITRRKQAKDKILSYSYDMLSADVSQFLLANITLPESHIEQAQSCIDAMLSALSLAAKGKMALESYANSRLIHAIESKSQFILEQSTTTPKDDIAKYRNTVEKVKNADRFRSENTLSFDNVNTAIKGPLSDLLSGAELVNQHVPFSGLDLMYSSPYDLSDIRKARLESLAASRYCTISEMVAYLLTDLFLEYFRINSTARHHAALVRLSDSLSAYYLYSDAIDSIYRECSF